MKDDSFENDSFEKFLDECWIYIKTVVDVAREPLLVLDKNFRVLAANNSYYRTFQVEKSGTVGNLLNKLGNGQWDITALKKLLDKILPHNTFFNGFEVDRIFPSIGHRIMLLNGRQIHRQYDSKSKKFPLMILLSIVDVTEMMSVAESLARQVNKFETMYSDRT